MVDDYPALTFTMTCGRRLDLFRRTMDSFLQNCLDQDLIARWLVSDDRSTPEDLEAMRREYPFLDIRSSLRPGQPASLNVLFARVTTEWFVSWEDDWKTVAAGCFLSEMIDIARTDPRIRNVVLRGWTGPFVKAGCVAYRIHVRNLHARHVDEIAKENDWCWFGYSLNPGLQHLPTVRMLGRYDESADTRYFDRPAALKYQRLGLIRANPLIQYVRHLGEDHPAWREP
jgi:hypothetical protein